MTDSKKFAVDQRLPSEEICMDESPALEEDERVDDSLDKRVNL